MVTTKMAMMAVICHERLSRSLIVDLGRAYLESPFWNESFRVRRESMVDHTINVFSTRQLGAGVVFEERHPAYPNIKDIMAVLPGFREDTAPHVYKYDSSGPNWLSISSTD